MLTSMHELHSSLARAYILVEVVLRHFHRHCYKGSPVVVLCWSELKSLVLTMDEHGEHQDLHGLSRWSVITYAHRKMGVVLLKRWFFLGCLVWPREF
jgi:hypothetical protein